MSSGPFENGKYESGSGRIYNCKTQPETKALTLGAATNDYPAGAVDQEVSAKLSGGKRETGVIARTVTLEWTGGAPTGYDADSNVVVPLFTPAVYNSSVPGTTGSYLGSSVRVVGRSPERVN